MAERRWLWPAGLLTLLAGCGDPAEDAAPVSAAIIPCAVAGASEFSEECIAKLIVTDGERHIVVSHPDGRSRRFIVLNDGRGLAVAEGGDDAAIAVDGTGIRVNVDGDRYRFPATISTNGTQ